MNSELSMISFVDAPIEIIDGDRGSNYPQHHEFFENEHCLFLNAGNVTSQGFVFDTCQFITQEKDKVLRKGKLCRADIVLTTRGTVGNVAFYNENVPYDNIRINSGMVIIRCDNKALNPLFVYQYLRSNHFQEQVNSLRSGAAQPQLPIRDIKHINLPFPDISLQNKIASILSAYDDLIENNLKRIKLLEEAAQLLYRQWFVDFKFPGHEKTKFINGIPEGWEKKHIGDVIELNYGKALKEDDRQTGDVPVYGSSGIVGYHNKPLINGSGIIVGRKGNVGSIFWSYEPFFPIDTVYYATTNLSYYYVYHVLKNTNFISSDSAVPGLNRNYAYSLPIITPDFKVISLFDNVIEKIFLQLRNLELQNHKLKEARDILLPRLMDGSIEI